MRFDLLFVNRRRLLIPFDPAARVLSFAIKRSYAQHATQSKPPVQNTSLPPASKRRRGAGPFPSLHSTSKNHVNLKSIESRPSPSSPSKRKKKPVVQPKPVLPGPYHNAAYINKEHNKSVVALKSCHKETPKNSLNNYYQGLHGNGKMPEYTTVEGEVIEDNKRIYVQRTTVDLDSDPPIIGVGDHQDKKRSIYLAALSAIYQLHDLGLLEAPKRQKPQIVEETEAVLSDGTSIDFFKARAFMDYYCRRYGFGRPDIEVSSKPNDMWETVLVVGGRRIGMGIGTNKKVSQTACFLDVTKYLESCDPGLWKEYVEASKTGADLGLAPKLPLSISRFVEGAIGDLCVDIKKTSLYRNRPSQGLFAQTVGDTPSQNHNRPLFQRNLLPKSQRLLEGRKAYLADPKLERIRTTRMSLPVYSQGKEVLDHIANNDVTICMAATGSGKTTQIPQMILDEYIDRGEGANCNIICTQPRRLAAISVADRVAKERGETLGKSIGYHVRFDSKLPLPDGSITFCTTGVFLKQLQSYLSEHEHSRSTDTVTHIVVDEVHERDIDTDLLLVVLKQILAQKKAKNQTLKIVLMSATIDPTLFENYFASESGVPAKSFTVPGRSFPVGKFFLDDYVGQISKGSSRWVFRDENVAKYLHNQLGPAAAASMGIRVSRPDVRDDELDLPYAFIAATVGHVLESSKDGDGHVLVFLPGWDDIIATQRALLSPPARHAVTFNDTSKYSIHLLHSSIPLADQQAIFEPPAAGVRRIILATNIAETSITIPDVVYVIDTAKIKEQRYDPERRISSLVTAWVGSSNLNQRAGRAGRHRPGEYYGILSKANADRLNPYQTVEMKRADLSNVVMHVKALNFSGLSVEEVLAAAIEAPDPSRVTAALNDLHMVGALDSARNLTSLGRVLVQLPMDAHLGRLVLYGSFFKCLDQALTLAAILASRDPFMSPMHLKREAAARKQFWCHDEDFRSDPLAVLKAYDEWSVLYSRGEHHSAHRFCTENFLSKPTFLLIHKMKGQVLQSLYRTGVIEVSAGGQVDGSGYDGSIRTLKVPPALDKNRNSFPLLVALIAIASQPRFGIRVGERTFRTSNDRNAMIHPSSVNTWRKEKESVDQQDERPLYAFADKRRNESTGSTPTTFLVGTTRLDPLTYILFGAHNVDFVGRGLECDDWLPIVGDIGVLDDVRGLKSFMEASMLRVFEGIAMSRLRKGQALPVRPREEESESESWDEDDSKKNYSLSLQEVGELDYMTRDIVNILNRHNEDRIARQRSRVAESSYRQPDPFHTQPGYNPDWLRLDSISP